MVAIQFKEINLNYGRKVVLEQLSFEVAQGKINVLLGPNGAGKTTALQIILGLLRPQNGEVYVLNGKPEQDSIKKQVGYVPQDLSFPPHLTAAEVLDYVCQLHGVQQEVSLIEKFGLTSFLKTRASQLSGGQKRRLGLALAFCAQPKLLILDEPTTGLDLESKVWFWQLIKNYSLAGGTVLLTTHDIYEISAMNCEGLLLNKGRTVARGSIDSLLAKAKYKKLSFQSKEKIQLSEHIEKMENDGYWYRCWTREPEKVLTTLVEQKIVFTDLQIERGSLEEVLQAMGGALQ